MVNIIRHPPDLPPPKREPDWRRRAVLAAFLIVWLISLGASIYISMKG